MKKILILVFVSTSLIFLVSCDKPAPTQLIDDSEFEVEILNKDLENSITNGADTSGVIQDLRGVTNLISVSGIKISNSVRTTHISLAQAMFFDKSKPIKNSNGKILAYETITPGTIGFNNVTARLDSFKLRYRDMGVSKVASLGQKYVLYNLFFGLPDPFYFNYESSVSFEFAPSGPGNNIEFQIPTPPEITGHISILGRYINRNIEATLSWNHRGERKISVIVGLVREGQTQSIPVYRIRTADDGEMRIPPRLLNEIPLDRFDKIVFTFVRSYENFYGNGSNELLVSSQSIHSIIIDIP